MKTMKEQFETISKITNRAIKLGLMNNNRFTLLLDLEVANDIFKLRLNDLLDSDNGNFCHDIIGIQKHIDRNTKTFMDCFVPRFSNGKN